MLVRIFRIVIVYNMILFCVERNRLYVVFDQDLKLPDATAGISSFRSTTFSR